MANLQFDANSLNLLLAVTTDDETGNFTVTIATPEDGNIVVREFDYHNDFFEDVIKALLFSDLAQTLADYRSM